MRLRAASGNVRTPAVNCSQARAGPYTGRVERRDLTSERYEHRLAAALPGRTLSARFPPTDGWPSATFVGKRLVIGRNITGLSRQFDDLAA